MIHNRYQLRGGEDVVYEQDTKLLRRRGHDVKQYEESNDRLRNMHALHALCRTVWSKESAHKLSHMIDDFKPDIIHVHNTFPLISPSIYYTAAKHHVPVIQTLHNYRLLCSNALFLRNGRVCEKCLGCRLPWHGIRYACYRQSRAATAVVVLMLVFHRLLGTWRRKVSRYIVLSDFCRQKFIEGGLPKALIAIRPNYVADPGANARVSRKGALFVGMLHSWKGCDVLLKAWDKVPGAEALTIVGDGPQSAVLKRMADSRVRFTGFLGAHETMQELQQARFLVFPSVWYEGMPRTLLEAMACGTPAIASRLGSMIDIVRDQKTGLLFDAGNADDLANKMKWAFDNSEAIGAMGKQARVEYLAKYTPEAAASALVGLYRELIGR